MLIGSRLVLTIAIRSISIPPEIRFNSISSARPVPLSLSDVASTEAGATGAAAAGGGAAGEGEGWAAGLDAAAGGAACLPHPTHKRIPNTHATFIGRTSRGISYKQKSPV